MESKMIEIKSSASAVVKLLYPERNLRKVWNKKGAVQKIRLEDLIEAIYEPGIEYLFRTGVLYTNDMEAKIALGLEEEGTTVPTNIVVLSEMEIKRMLGAQPIHEVKAILETLSHEQIVEIGNQAIESRVFNQEKLDLIDSYVHMNLFKVINNKIQMDREEKLEQNKG